MNHPPQQFVDWASLGLYCAEWTVVTAGEATVSEDRVEVSRERQSGRVTGGVDEADETGAAGKAGVGDLVAAKGDKGTMSGLWEQASLLGMARW